MFSGHLLTCGEWVSYHLLTDLKDSWREKLKPVLLLGFHRPRASLTAGLHLSAPVCALSRLHYSDVVPVPSPFPSLQRRSSVQAFPSSARLSSLRLLLRDPGQPHTWVTAVPALRSAVTLGPEKGRKTSPQIMSHPPTYSASPTLDSAGCPGPSASLRSLRLLLCPP